MSARTPRPDQRVWFWTDDEGLVTYPASVENHIWWRSKPYGLLSWVEIGIRAANALETSR